MQSDKPTFYGVQYTVNYICFNQAQYKQFRPHILRLPYLSSRSDIYEKFHAEFNNVSHREPELNAWAKGLLGLNQIEWTKKNEPPETPTTLTSSGFPLTLIFSLHR